MARQYANMQTQGPVQGQHCCCSCGIGIAFGVLQEETSRLRAELKARDEKVELTKKNDTADLKYRKRESLALQTENDRLHKTIKNQKNEIKRLLKKVADKEEKINKLQAYIEAQISRCEVYLKSTLDKNGSTIRELSEEICRLKTEGNRLDAQLKNMRALDSQQMKDAGLKTQRINQLMAQVDAKNAENDQLRLAIRGSVDMPTGRPTPWREQILKLEEEIRIQRQQIDKSYQVGAQMAGRDRKIDFFKWPEEEEVTGPQNCQLNKDDRFNPLLDTVSHLRKELKARDRYIKHLEEVNNTQARNLVWQANINPTQLLKSGQIQTFAQVQAETMALHRATVQRLQDTQTATDKLAEDKSMGREVHGKKTDQNRDDTDKSPDVQDKVTETQGKNMEVLAKVTEIQDMSAEPQWMARREKKRAKPFEDNMKHGGLKSSRFQYGSLQTLNPCTGEASKTASVPEEREYKGPCDRCLVVMVPCDGKDPCSLCVHLKRDSCPRRGGSRRAAALGYDLPSEEPTAKVKTDDEIKKDLLDGEFTTEPSARAEHRQQDPGSQELRITLSPPTEELAKVDES